MKKSFILIVALLLGAQPVFAISPLNLIPQCTDNASTTLNWAVTNPNSVIVPFHWDRGGGFEDASSTVQANATTTFSTAYGAILSTNRVTLTWYDPDASNSPATTSADAIYDGCPAAATSTPSTSSNGTQTGTNLSGVSQSGGGGGGGGYVAPAPVVTALATSTAPILTIGTTTYTVLDNPVTIQDFEIKILWLLEQLLAIMVGQGH